MALIGPGALGYRKAIVQHCILKCREVSCQRERRFLGLVFRKGALFVPAVLNVWAATLYKMLRQTSGVALSGIAVARIGAALGPFDLAALPGQKAFNRYGAAPGDRLQSGAAPG